MTFLGIWALLWTASAGTSTSAIKLPFVAYSLENGLKVILSEDHTLPITAVNVWYHAGPLNEPPRRTGFAHLFEHLMFQGSKHVGDDMHFALLEARGASGTNGTTDYDRTNYFETVPAQELELALWLESDRMGFLRETLTQAKLDTQREVVLNERRQSYDNAPYGPSSERLVQLLFPPAHPYFGHIIGSMADLRAAELADVVAFHDRFYAPANATLALVGDFDPGQARAMIARYFGTLPARPAPAPVLVTTPPILEERRAEVREPVSLPRLTMAWLAPAAYRPGDADADVLAAILGGGTASRLHQRLVYDLQLAQGVGAQQQSLAAVSIFQVTATAKPGVTLARLEAALEAVLQEMRQTPPTAAEIDRARNGLLTSMLLSLQNVGGYYGRADILNRYSQYVGDPGYMPQDLARYAAVTPASVQALAQTLLEPAHRAVVLTVPK